jgi:hypothetical protein
LGDHSLGGIDGYIGQVDSSGHVTIINQVGTVKQDYLYALAKNNVVDETEDPLVNTKVYVGGCTDGSFGGITNAGSFDNWLGCYDLNEGKFFWKAMLGSISYGNPKKKKEKKREAIVRTFKLYELPTSHIHTNDSNCDIYICCLEWLYSIDIVEDVGIPNTFNVAAGGVTLGGG